MKELYVVGLLGLSLIACLAALLVNLHAWAAASFVCAALHSVVSAALTLFSATVERTLDNRRGKAVGIASAKKRPVATVLDVVSSLLQWALFVGVIKQRLWGLALQTALLFVFAIVAVVHVSEGMKIMYPPAKEKAAAAAVILGDAK